jgi:hypothetical protein
MLVFLSPIEFSPDGPLRIDALPESSAGEIRRRVNRIATLDGSAVFNDFGFSDSDRTMEIRWRPVDQAQADRVAWLVSTYALIHASTREGFFLAAPESYIPGSETSVLRLLVKAKLSA